MGRVRQDNKNMLPKGMHEKSGSYYFVTSEKPRKWINIGKDFKSAIDKYHEILSSGDVPKFKEKKKKTERSKLGLKKTCSAETESVVRMLYMRSVRGAKTRNIRNYLTIADVDFLYRSCNGKCSITGIDFKFELENENWKSNPWSPSIDRIDSSKGYSATNCRVVCNAVNRALGEWGDDVFFKFCKAAAQSL